jgi:hypothetical protein
MNVGDSIRWLPEEPEARHRLYEPGTFVRFITPQYESSSSIISVV